jgi:hypothetical protein
MCKVRMREREDEHLLKEGQESLAKLKEPEEVIGEKRGNITSSKSPPNPKQSNQTD